MQNYQIYGNKEIKERKNKPNDQTQVVNEIHKIINLSEEPKFDF